MLFIGLCGCDVHVEISFAREVLGIKGEEVRYYVLAGILSMF
jgi:hypothetical protein